MRKVHPDRCLSCQMHAFTTAVCIPCRSGMLKDMEDRGVECVDCYSVDNALIRPADPLFIGICSHHNSDSGAPCCAVGSAFIPLSVSSLGTQLG